MSRVVFVTGATDGLGLAAARQLIARGHSVLVHGRNGEKVKNVVAELTDKLMQTGQQVKGYV